MTGTERMRLTRARRRRGERMIRLIVKEPQIDVLVARGYDLDRTDDESIARAMRVDPILPRAEKLTLVLKRSATTRCRST
jgi:hypothetical protein